MMGRGHSICIRRLASLLVCSFIPIGLGAADSVDQLRINGMELSIRAFAFDGTVESIAKAWLADAPADSTRAVHASEDGRRVIIARLIGTTSETVTIRPSTDPVRAEVIIARYDLRASIKRPPSPPVRLPRSHVVTDVIEWLDADATTLFQIYSQLTPSESSRDLEERLRMNGWRIEGLSPYASQPRGMGGWWAVREGQQLAVGIAASREGGSRVVLQWRRPDAKT